MNLGHYEGSLLQSLPQGLVEQAVKVQVKKVDKTDILIEIKNSICVPHECISQDPERVPNSRRIGERANTVVGSVGNGAVV